MKKTKVHPINRSKFNSLFCLNHIWISVVSKVICKHCKIEKASYEYIQKELKK